MKEFWMLVRRYGWSAALIDTRVWASMQTPEKGDAVHTAVTMSGLHGVEDLYLVGPVFGGLDHTDVADLAAYIARRRMSHPLAA